MNFNVKMIADSYCYRRNSRISTLQLKYPRFIHSEFMTHRVFSRNASSSRAIPVSKMILDVLENPAFPVHWGKSQAGMQAFEQCDELIEIDDNVYSREKAWLLARDYLVKVAKAYDKSGYHKQVVNRLLEPFAHISVIVTSTDWDNFFELRNHEDAQPEIKTLAEMMYQCLHSSVPKDNSLDWHLPYILDEERENTHISELLKMSAARCARVSYLTHNGKTPSIEADVKLFNRLVKSKPLHASPLEHQAVTSMVDGLGDDNYFFNLRGWQSQRWFIENKIEGFEV